MSFPGTRERPIWSADVDSADFRAYHVRFEQFPGRRQVAAAGDEEPRQPGNGGGARPDFPSCEALSPAGTIRRSDESVMMTPFVTVRHPLATPGARRQRCEGVGSGIGAAGLVICGFYSLNGYDLLV